MADRSKTGAPVHTITYLKSNDDRRHKSRCVHYDKLFKECTLSGKLCSSSTYCSYYRSNDQDMEDNDIIQVRSNKYESIESRKYASDTIKEETQKQIEELNKVRKSFTANQQMGSVVKYKEGKVLSDQSLYINQCNLNKNQVYVLKDVVSNEIFSVGIGDAKFESNVFDVTNKPEFTKTLKNAKINDTVTINNIKYNLLDKQVD